MMSRKDQADKLRALAQRQGISQKDNEHPFVTARKGGNILLKILKVFFTLVIVIIIVGILGVAVYFYIENNKKDKDLIRSLSEQGESLKHDVAMLTDKAKAIENEVVKSTKENQDLTKQVATIHVTNDQLKSDLNKIQQDKLAISNDLVIANKKIQDIEATKQELQAQMHAQLQGLEAQVRDLKMQRQNDAQSLALGKNDPQARLQSIQNIPVPAAMGRIILVNKKMQFVIVNMGKNQGITNTTRFIVVRGNAPIAHLKVIEMRAEVSACDSGDPVDDLMLGDSVKVQ